ncbi:RNA polymerase sigma factor [Candidatus Uabimicrobium amorphum]|uniref:RNA polymerase sigma factor 70 region 4 type 2 domain-containing protein n=1 Tax=Uabimicrobium amorphum TaxID=2596890 RepID=A0A5S9F2G0_UABAM|nr:sigma factor-like helix-turn-helix DNA-binding protein [Candidatus Uabimicrobium amorphum]BBM82354.1 hypothetical protein UABAM_00697 [Candidatus Uabimicrobium amorphum]
MNKRLLEVLQKQPKQQRIAFILCEVGGFTYKEIAQEMNISVGAVGRYISNVRQELFQVAQRENIDFELRISL